MEKAIKQPRTGAPIRSSKVATRRGEMRAKLLTAGAHLFVARGIANVSVEDLIEQAGISRATFYGFFANKHELAASILMPVFESGADALRELVDLPARDIAAGIVRVYLGLWREHADALLLTGYLDGKVFPYFQTQHDAFNALLLALLQRLEAEGLLNNGSARLTLEVFATTAIPLLRIYRHQDNFDALFERSLLGLVLAR